MHKITLLLLSTILLSSVAYAGGHIFGGKHKTSNPNGVYAIGVHICGSLECPKVRITQGSCTGDHMSKHWGVCVCDKGYVASGDHCDPCPAGQVSDGINGCQTCPEGTYRANATDTQCTPCPTADVCGPDDCCLDTDICGRPKKGGFKGNDGVCYLCDEASDIQANDCGSCDNRETFTKMNWDIGEEEIYCTLKCSGFRDYEGNCHTCDETNPVYAPDCGKCTSWEYFVNTCYPTPCLGFRDYDGKCHTCDETSEVDAYGCGKCTSWEYFDNTCYPTPCLGFRDYSGDCHTCDETSAVNAPNCGKCTNWEDDGGKCLPPCSGFFGYDDNCHTCDETSPVYTSDCGKCTNWEHFDEICWPPCSGLRDYSGNCHPCNDMAVFGTSENCSEKCPNRETYTPYERGNTYCILTEESCEGFRDHYEGNCHTCDETDSVYVADGNCGKCTSWEKDAGYCVPTHCEGFRTTDGVCHECDTTNPDEYYDAISCGTCTNREYFYSGENTESWCFPDKCEGFRSWNGQCHQCNESNPVNAYDKGHCDNWDCIEEGGWSVSTCYPPCENGFRGDDRECHTCDAADMDAPNCGSCTDTREMLGNKCVKKCNPATQFRGLDELCHTCDETAEVAVNSADDCSICTDWEYSSYTGKCYPTCLASTSESGYRTWSGYCNKCSAGIMEMDNGGYSEMSNSLSLSCGDCTNRELYTYTDPNGITRQYCRSKADVDSSHFLDITGARKYCNSSSHHQATAEECARCPGRDYVLVQYDDGSLHEYCNLHCDGFWDKYANCHSCDEQQDIEAPNCGNCATRIYEGGKCKLNCNDGEHFLADDGKCYPCSQRWGKKATEAGCAMCQSGSNPRTIYEHDGEKYCGLLTCPENYFHNEYDCSSCSSVSAYEIYDDQQLTCVEECQSSGTQRKVFEHEGQKYCSLTDCTGDGKYQTLKGSCSNCTINLSNVTTKPECDRCGALRTWDPDTGKCTKV